MSAEDDEAKLDRVFSGRLDQLPPAPSKVVRIFTSSTFTGSPFPLHPQPRARQMGRPTPDTTTERNALMEEVYPKIKEYCREKHGLDFQVRPSPPRVGMAGWVGL